ncbi:uncharacterized protein LOC115229029 [Argonauta hians]
MSAQRRKNTTTMKTPAASAAGKSKKTALKTPSIQTKRTASPTTRSPTISSSPSPSSSTATSATTTPISTVITTPTVTTTTPTTTTITQLGYNNGNMSDYQRRPGLYQPNYKRTVFTRKIRPRQTKFFKMRKRLAKLLHTHAALILLSFLVVMDATCVIGQLLADIFIVKEKLDKTETEKHELADVLQTMFPHYFNTTDDLSLHEILDHLKNALEINNMSNISSRYSQNLQANTNHSAQFSDSIKDIPAELANTDINSTDLHNRTLSLLQEKQTLLVDTWKQLKQSQKDNENILKLMWSLQLKPLFSAPANQTINSDKLKKYSSKQYSGKSDKSDDDDAEEHNILFEITHIFHLTSLIILSILLFETLLKVFAMGRKLLSHKIEVFDAIVIVISWSLDVAFKDGIWDHPGSNAATILIILLPWRVIRIVNSFVLVIQEKDHVRLKLIKQRYRSSERRTREYKEKVNDYRVQTKSLQGVCRKFGVPERQITACMPAEKRKRCNLALKALSEFASLAMVSSVGSLPNLASKSEFSSDSSSSDDDDDSSDQHRGIDRCISTDSVLSQTDSLFSAMSYQSDAQNNNNNNNISLSYGQPNVGDSTSLPTYEDAVTSVYNSNDKQSKQQNTKL